MLLIHSTTTKVIKVVVSSSSSREARRLSESEDWLVDLQIPDHDLSILTCTCQDVRDHSVPTYGSNSWSLMIVRYTWLKHVWRLDIMRNILDQNLRSTTSEQILFVWIEFNWINWDTVVNIGSWYTTSTHFKLLLIIAWAFDDFSCIPKCNSSISHS